MDYASRVAQDVVPELFRDIRSAKGLPHWMYNDPDYFEYERQALFKATWVGVAYEQDLPAPGSIFPVRYAGWDILLTRTLDGDIRAFYNICRHRGMKLAGEPKTGCKTISCPWHMWGFALDGSLVSTPHIGGLRQHSQEELDRSSLGLVPIRCGVSLGVVYVNLDGKAPPLEEFVAPFVARFAPFDLGLARESDLTVEMHYDANWKFVIEGAVEDYHIPYVHPQIGPQGLYTAVTGGDRYIGVASRRDMSTAVKRIPGTDDATRGRTLPTFPHFPETGEFEASIILTLVPSTVVAAQIHHMVVTLYIPETMTRTRVRRRFRFIGEGADDPAYEAARNTVRDSWNTVSEQDGWVHQDVQGLTASRADADFRAVFSEHWEGAVHHFQKIVAARLSGTPLG